MQNNRSQVESVDLGWIVESIVKIDITVAEINDLVKMVEKGVISLKSNLLSFVGYVASGKWIQVSEFHSVNMDIENLISNICIIPNFTTIDIGSKVQKLYSCLNMVYTVKNIIEMIINCFTSSTDMEMALAHTNIYTVERFIIWMLSTMQDHVMAFLSSVANYTINRCDITTYHSKVRNYIMFDIIISLMEFAREKINCNVKSEIVLPFLSKYVVGIELDEPVDDEPVDDEPVDDEPVDDEPVDDEPVDGAYFITCLNRGLEEMVSKEVQDRGIIETSYNSANFYIMESNSRSILSSYESLGFRKIRKNSVRKMVVVPNNKIGNCWETAGIVKRITKVSGLTTTSTTVVVAPIGPVLGKVFKKNSWFNLSDCVKCNMFANVINDNTGYKVKEMIPFMENLRLRLCFNLAILDFVNNRWSEDSLHQRSVTISELLAFADEHKNLGHNLAAPPTTVKRDKANLSRTMLKTIEMECVKLSQMELIYKLTVEKYWVNVDSEFHIEFDKDVIPFFLL